MSILFAYCGKESDKVLDFAIHHSILYSEPLYIATVVKEEQMDPDNMDESIRQYMEAAQKRAASQGATVHSIIEVGYKPGEAIIEIAQRFKPFINLPKRIHNPSGIYCRFFLLLFKF